MIWNKNNLSKPILLHSHKNYIFLKIAVDTRLLLKDRMDGLGLFTEGSFKHIVSQHPKIDFVFIFDREPHPDFIFGKNVLVTFRYK